MVKNREQDLLDTIKQIRESKTVKLRPSVFLRPTFKTLDGEEREFQPRYYQVQGAFHLLALKRMVLGDDTGTGKCVTLDTRITTNRGLIPIGEMGSLEGTAPDTFGPTNLPYQVEVDGESYPVKRFYNGGVKPIRRLYTYYGHKLGGSLVHRVKVLRGGVEDWVTLGDLQIGDMVRIDVTAVQGPVRPVVVNNAAAKNLSDKLTVDMAKLAALFLLRGNWKHEEKVSLTFKPKDWEGFLPLTQSLFKSVFKNKGSISKTRVYVEGEKYRAYWASVGCEGEKRIPECIMRAPQEVQLAFLQTYCNVQGHLKRDQFQVLAHSLDIARDLQQLLVRNGVYAQLKWFNIDTDDNGTLVVVRGHQIKVLLQKIELLTYDLKRAWASPVISKVVGNFGQEIYLPGEFDAIRNYQKQYANDCNRANNCIMSYELGRLVSELEKDRPDSPHLATLKVLQTTTRRYDTVVQIEDGQEQVVDLEVDHESHSYVSNGIVSHNTVQAIMALCHMVEKNPKTKAIIITPKSTVHQWASEINRFTTGIRAIPVDTQRTTKGMSPLEYRKSLYRDWVESEDPAVLILNYNLLVRDWDEEGVTPLREDGSPDPKKPVVPGVLDQATRDVSANLVTFSDECQAYKNTKTKTWEKGRALNDRSTRAYGLTATLLGSNLMEGYCIYKCIKPDLFGSKTKFMEQFCRTELQSVPGMARKIPIIVGYKNLKQFREIIDPFFLGRKKQDISDELPVLLSKMVECPLSDAEDRKYAEALSGILELGDGEIRDFEEHKALISLLYCQQVVDSLALLKFDGGSRVADEEDMFDFTYKEVVTNAVGAKEQALLDLVSGDGELAGKKVIIYTRFAKLVPRLHKLLAKAKVRAGSITGNSSLNVTCIAESGFEKPKPAMARQAAQELFQAKDSGLDAVLITNAGGVGINLQMAEALIFYDLPWTWGDYVQTLGRMIRIGSPHRGVSVYHLLATRPNDSKMKTIDHHVYALLRKKQNLIDQVLGESAAGALDFDKDSSGIKDLVKSLQRGL